MSSRFLSELENNHHYIVVDTVTGHSYYVPGQIDSGLLSGLLNSQLDTINQQRHHIKELESTLREHNLSFEPNRSCNNCNYMTIHYINNHDEGFCELKDRGVSVEDYCGRWILKEE